jgi:hypothetical protein
MDHPSEARIIQSGSHTPKAATIAAFTIHLCWTVEPLLPPSSIQNIAQIENRIQTTF